MSVSTQRSAARAAAGADARGAGSGDEGAAMPARASRSILETFLFHVWVIAVDVAGQTLLSLGWCDRDPHPGAVQCRRQLGRGWRVRHQIREGGEGADAF